MPRKSPVKRAEARSEKADSTKIVTLPYTPAMKQGKKFPKGRKEKP